MQAKLIRFSMCQKDNHSFFYSFSAEIDWWAESKLLRWESVEIILIHLFIVRCRMPEINMFHGRVSSSFRFKVMIDLTISVIIITEASCAISANFHDDFANFSTNRISNCSQRVIVISRIQKGINESENTIPHASTHHQSPYVWQ